MASAPRASSTRYGISWAISKVLASISLYPDVKGFAFDIGIDIVSDIDVFCFDLLISRYSLNIVSDIVPDIVEKLRYQGGKKCQN